VRIAQLVAHAAEEFILCVRGGDAALPKLLLGFLVYFVLGKCVTYTAGAILSAVVVCLTHTRFGSDIE